jgi:hypothetical protein
MGKWFLEVDPMSGNEKKDRPQKTGPEQPDGRLQQPLPPPRKGDGTLASLNEKKREPKKPK